MSVGEVFWQIKGYALKKIGDYVIIKSNITLRKVDFCGKAI